MRIPLSALKKFTSVTLSLAILHYGMPIAEVWGNQGGSSTATFLRIGQGSRAQGMGGAFTAVADDAHAVYWNPAGLARVSRKQLGLEHVSFIDDINSQYVVFAMPIPRAYGSFGVSATVVDMGEIERLDNTGAAVAGDTDVSGHSGTLSWGQAFGENLSLGAGIKFVRQNLAGEEGSGVAGDVGLHLSLLPEKLFLGAAASNLGPKIKTGTQEEDLPQTFRGGLAYYPIPGALVVAIDGEKERDTDVIMRGGGEFTYMNQFILRLGYQETHEASGGFTAGLGFVWRPSENKGFGFLTKKRQTDKSYMEEKGFALRLDYSYVDLGDFDSTHRFGVHMFF